MDALARKKQYELNSEKACAKLEKLAADVALTIVNKLQIAASRDCILTVKDIEINVRYNEVDTVELKESNFTVVHSTVL